MVLMVDSTGFVAVAIVLVVGAVAGGADGGGIAGVAVLMVGGVVRLVVGFQIMNFHEMCFDCQFSWQVLAGHFRFSSVLLGL